MIVRPSALIVGENSVRFGLLMLTIFFVASVWANAEKHRILNAISNNCFIGSILNCVRFLFNFLLPAPNCYEGSPIVGMRKFLFHSNLCFVERHFLILATCER